MSEEVYHIKPQEGFQTKVALSKADVTIIGGAAGGGKSFIMLYIAAMYRNDPKLRAVYFRHTQAQIREPGAIWDESTQFYGKLGGEPNETNLRWKFPNGGTVDFNGLQYDKDVLNFQGAQILLEFFDELTQFTKKKFFYLLGRNRGVLTDKQDDENNIYIKSPQTFASCNPDPDSWVAGFIAWYIDQDTGYPIPERDGKIRYFMIVDDKPIWGNTKTEVYNEVIKKKGSYFSNPDFLASGIRPRELIKSFTFIGGKIYENKILLKSNPGYLGNLLTGTEADQEKLLKGNWKVRDDDTGLYDNDAVDEIFIEAYQERKIERDYANSFITCDAAKFGRDLCVIFVWHKFTIIHTTVFYHSSVQDIHNEIQVLMNEFGVLRKNVLIDQDGVGGDVVKLGGYYGFMARRICADDPTTGEKENYVKRKDQCYYRSADRVNNRGVKWICLNSTTKVYFRGDKRPTWTTMLDWDNDKVHIKTLASRQLRAIKRGKVEFEMGLNKYEGGDLRLCTNTKDEQKEILGHSPDIADNFMMREDFELMRRTKGVIRTY